MPNGYINQQLPKALYNVNANIAKNSCADLTIALIIILFSYSNIEGTFSKSVR